MNRISLASASGKNFSYLDILIDGQSVTRLLDPEGDGVIPPFGWPGPSGRTLEAAAAARLLLRSEADLPDNRRSILVCNMDADIDCGAITAVVESTPDVFIWRVCGWESNLCEESGERLDFDVESYAHAGPFAFPRQDYEALFQPFLASAPTASPPL